MLPTLWSEKYRPQTVKDCILPQRIKKVAAEIVASGECQNLLLAGPAGCGKTTLARAICRDLDCDSMLINCSEDSGIDTLRVGIRNYATTVSLSGKGKVIIMDEFDYANGNSFQPALRGAIEEFSGNCRFIFTCNYQNRVIEAIHSRCICIDFTFSQKEREAMEAKFFSRLKKILEEEKVTFDEKVLAKVVQRHSPDFRRILNELQGYAKSGTVDVGILSVNGDLSIQNVVVAMKSKNYGEVRKWVAENSGGDANVVIRKFFDALDASLVPSSIPEAIVILGEGQRDAAMVADQEINTLSYLTKIMLSCEFQDAA